MQGFFSLSKLSRKPVAMVSLLPRQLCSPVQFSRADQIAKTNVNQFLHHLTYLGRKGNVLALRNLKHLIYKCVEPRHVKHAVGGIKLYQNKRQDFSEEICTLFIKSCVKGQNPVAAAELIADPSQRIGAWLSRSANMHLMTALAEKQELDLMLQVAKVSLAKGLHVQTPDSAKLLIQVAADKADLEAYKNTTNILSKFLSDDELASLIAAYPGPVEEETVEPTDEEKVE